MENALSLFFDKKYLIKSNGR